ncbi:MAG: ATP-binding protein [Clostridiales bacterium]|nr:ATP-binding protein [Clostridiales bacterium]
MKNRDDYLNRLIALKDKSLIKVITGVRRCGKSSLLDLYEDYLLQTGVDPENIIRINFESLEFDRIKDYRDLNQYVTAHITGANKVYLLLDEVQMVKEWERTVNSLRLDKKLDIYITGSNGHLLASELSTLLSGRYIEFHMFPLSFKEFLYFNDYTSDKDLQDHFHLYLERGGLPGLTELKDHEPAIRPYLNGIYNTIIMKDVIAKGDIRDPALLENVVRFMAGNIGNPVSSKKISDYLTSGGRKTASETIDNYLHLLENAYILYRAARFDLKGKQQLKTQGKYYIVDTGIRGELTGKRGQDYGSVLENIVYFELLRRGFDVKTGSLSGQEVDFVATKPDKTVYYQVTATMLSDETRKRELRSLSAIPDNYEKVVLSMDRTPFTDYDGIKNINLLDFLLSGHN